LGASESFYGAVEDAVAKSENLASWDLHATATPGDFSEMATFRSIFPEPVLVAARKGTFGHGMSAGGGWELTAQYLGYEQGRLFPTPLKKDELNESIRQVHGQFVFDTGCETPEGLAGKLSMGIGGINACVISRPLR
jgi:3-oxoacyl-(acyl-carrier-protein) synthase